MPVVGYSRSAMYGNKFFVDKPIGCTTELGGHLKAHLQRQRCKSVFIANLQITSLTVIEHILREA